MAAKGFIKLLEMVERSRARTHGLSANGQAANYWSGVGFMLDSQYYLAAMGEVSEVLAVPRYTRVPGTKDWMKGIANIRGRLLPIMDLPGYFNRRSCVAEHRRRLIVIDQGHIFSGLIVDDVLGIQHFSIPDYICNAPDIPVDLTPFVQGAFRREGCHWTIFSLSRLVEDPAFLQAAKN